MTFRFPRTRGLLVAAGVTLAVALAPAAALAQRPPARADSTSRDSLAAQRLSPIQVIGSILSMAGPAVSSGVPARTSTIGRREIERWQPRLLTGALATQAGFSLYDDLGSPFKPTIVTRGFTTSPVVGLPQGVSVFVDGVPVNEADAGQVNFDLLPLGHVERVEVLSGTASLLGPNSLGGAVNLVTRRGEGPATAEIEIGGGSFGRYSVEGSAGGGASGWSWYAGGGWEREGGWRQLTAARVGSGFVNVGREWERGGLALQAFVSGANAQTAGSLPESVHGVQPDSNLSAGDFEALEQLHVALTGHRLLGGGRGSFRAYLRRHDAERFNVNQIDDPDVRGFSRNRTGGAMAGWSTALPAGDGDLELRVGAGGAASGVEIRLYGERIDPGITTHVETPIREGNAYALADYRVGRVTLTGGARYDVVRIPFRNRLRPERDTTSSYHHLSPRAGISVEVVPGASLYASAGRSFRAPAVIELACADPEQPCPLPFALGDDPPLDPVIAATYEVGGRIARGPAELSVSAYSTNVRNEIFLHPYEDESEPEGSTIDGYFANLDRTRREGVELGAQLAVPGGHLLDATWAWTRATFQSPAEVFSIREHAGEENDVEPGDRMPLVPAQTLTVGGMARLPAGLTLGARARYTGERWARGDEANVTQPLESYWVADARIGWGLGAWEVQAVVRNVLDTDYVAFGTFNINQAAGDVLERFLTPGEPRRLEVTLRRSFVRGG
ncbi:MAG TPA: TonB-dependent receptor [Gemmatimonadales bacterium]